MSPLSGLMPEILNQGGPKITTGHIIGISIAIAGNVLISLALNLQKLAHRRVGQGKSRAQQRRNRKRPATGRNLDDLHELETDSHSGHAPGISQAEETQPLLAFSTRGSDYGASQPGPRRSNTFSLTQFFTPKRKRMNSAPAGPIPSITIPVDVVTNANDDHPTPKPPTQPVQEGNESDYLRSKLWWLGFLLMNVGELGNFISYAFAPASIVAPLGTFALIANCIFAPLLLGERFRKRDLIGMFLAIIGAVTVVLSANGSDVRFDPDGLIKAISQKPFIAYSCVYIIGAIILSIMSEGKYGRQWVVVDVGLCALYGGFTVLSTKAVSTLLTMKWMEMFTSWITYPVLATLIGTGVAQVRYLNRALMRFDSKVVIPSQFVLFNLSVIIGSAILYGDFKKASFHQMMTFLYGCTATFGGVFVIAWSSSLDQNEDEDEEAHSQPSARASLDSRDQRNGSVSKRRRAVLSVLNTGSPTPILRHRHSAISIIGVSPAQHLFLQSPSDATPGLPREFDLERDTTPATPDSLNRRRAISWLGEDGRRTRDSSITARSRLPAPSFSN